MLRAETPMYGFRWGRMNGWRKWLLVWLGALSVLTQAGAGCLAYCMGRAAIVPVLILLVIGASINAVIVTYLLRALRRSR